MSKLRIVMIEQDQATYKRISDLLNDELAIEMIKFTNQRKKGFELIKKYKPDIALIDICFIKESDWNESPFSSLPIIILARPLVDEVAKTLRAISLGAVDFINKKDLYERSFKQDLMFKINNAFKRKKSHSSVRLNKRANDKYELSKEVTFKDHQDTVVVIGTSTGGPKALQNLLQSLPKNFPAPIFIVQHMPSGFTKSLAKRLNRTTKLTIKEAVDGDVVKNGTVYIAPGDSHLTVRMQGSQLLTHTYKGKLYRGYLPSVDLLFQSVAKLKNTNKIAVILTGMGRDGAEGIKTIKEYDESALIIVESEQSAVIFGMPQAALKTGHVTCVAHINEIGKLITEYVER